MKRLLLWLTIALTTFTLGIGAVVIYFNRSERPNLSPPTGKNGKPILTVASCFPGLSIKVENIESSSYFPPGVFSSQPEQEQYIANWYSKPLKVMNESALFSLAKTQSESYRFLWFRSFNSPVAVHIWRSGDERFITLKQLSDTGGRGFGRLITDKTRSLTESEWDKFIALLEQTCYWKMPTEDNKGGGLDGARWILEGYKEGRYHVVDRWSPKEGDFREACLYLLKASGIDLSSEEVY
ncbi:MAG: hypothetical protein QOC96_953 [Acidobacteriota bacterium]|jgi:hypothetical protein|nr:hypothetical protein [Acidobacteriota bacterium]